MQLLAWLTNFDCYSILYMAVESCVLSYLSYIHPGSTPSFLRKLSQAFGYCLHPCYASKINFRVTFAALIFALSILDICSTGATSGQYGGISLSLTTIFLLIALVNFDV